MAPNAGASRNDTLGVIVNSLFTLVEGVGSIVLPISANVASVAGYKFEDDAAKAAYEALVQVGVAPSKPRHKLQLPTLSGLRQQFDIVVPSGSHYFIVELKRRSHSEIEQLYAFVAKLLDYALAARCHATGNVFTGIFVSTAPKLNDHFRQFAISYGVISVAPDLPPCEVLQVRAVDVVVQHDAADLAKRLYVSLPDMAIQGMGRAQSDVLLREWQSIAQRS